MMISVAEAQKIILQKMKSADVAELPILQSAGAVLAEKVKAERDYPPFDRVTMDGIGICYSQYASGRRDFAILGVVGAGYD
ncbi:MAG: molybdopterin molybdenumtransferase MoeA, partial [Lentisphaeraceae bacterium]|nr:molybdopterin molybdenumtransferase MoeA [Lentisphaeraceae bacterium]